jgi:glycosyltransferase involved in cell wall biosynthesis
MRLLLTSLNLAAGGTERIVSTLASVLSDRGHAVAVVTDASKEHDHYLLGPSIRRIAFDSSSRTQHLPHQVARNLVRVKRMRQTIHAFQPDAIISFGATVNLRSLLASVGLGVPVIVSERVDPRTVTLPWGWRLLRRPLYAQAARIVVQTESVAVWARELAGADRVCVIPNPVRPLDGAAACPGSSGERKKVIAVGRLDPQKGFDLLLAAFRQSSLASTWQLVILGEGSERVALERQVADLGLQGSVLMPGVVRDPERWLQHAQLFVLSSRFEGFPNALLEAMQCKVAVAAFDCPSGPAEIVRHEQTGLLVPAGDVDALAAAITRLAADPELRQRLGTAAAADVTTRFSLERITDLWEKALAGCGSSAR